MNYGPTFGSGHDFYIGDNGTGYCNFPHAYNINGKYTNGQPSYEAFSGSTNGYHVTYA